jgi:DHA2 family methylenomycin A resistance protein-like MFS transporter
MRPLQSARPAGAPAVHRRGRALILLTVCLALFLALLDSTALSIALPLIARDLNTGMSGLQWTADGYVLVMAGFLLTSGIVGDRIGRKHAFLAGVALFTIGSVVAALAGSLAMLVAGRTLQGLGAAGMSPQTLAIIGAAYPERRERARALGIWSGTSGLALVIGPVAGGLLADRWGWQSIFWINVPLGALALVLGARVIRTPVEWRPRPVDVVGQVFAVGALVALTIGVINAGTRQAGSPAVLIPLGVALACLAGLVLAERRAAEPMFSRELLRSRAFVGAITVLFLVAFGMYASFFLVSLELQDVHGLGPAAAGLRLIPAMAAAVLAAPLAGRLAAQLGERIVVAAATAAAGIALAVLSQVDLAAPYSSWWPLLVLLGLGVGGTFSPTNSALLHGAPAHSTGVAGALGQLCQQAGTAIGVAALGAATVLAVRERLRTGLVGLGLNAQPDRLAHDLIGGPGRAGADLTGVASGPLLRHALTAGVQSGLLIGGLAFLVAAVVAAALLPGQSRERSSQSSG